MDNMAGTFTFLKGKRQACQVLVDEENHQVYHKNVIKVLGLYITMREERMTYITGEEQRHICDERRGEERGPGRGARVFLYA